MKKWALVSIANGPYVKYLKAMLESVRASGTNVDVVVTVVNSGHEELKPLCDVVIGICGQTSRTEESRFCVHHKPHIIKQAMGEYEHVVFLDADSVVWGNLDKALEDMEGYDFCCKRKKSGRITTPMLAMKSSDKMRRFCDFHAEATRVRAAQSKKPWGAGQRSMHEVWDKYHNEVSLYRIPGDILDVKWRIGSLIWTACRVDGPRSHDALLQHWVGK